LQSDATALANRIIELLDLASIPKSLREHQIPAEKLPHLAELAAKQWTAHFNPRPLSEADLHAIYQSAY